MIKNKRISEQSYLRKKLQKDNPWKSLYDDLVRGNNYGEKMGKNGDVFIVRYHYEKKWLRKVNNRKVRRHKGEISNGNSYRKLNEFQWEVY